MTASSYFSGPPVIASVTVAGGRAQLTVTNFRFFWPSLPSISTSPSLLAVVAHMRRI
jgi:hypothetical protein